MQIISIFFIFIWDLTDLTFPILSLMFILHVLILEILDVFYLTNESGFFFMYRLWSGLHHISSISKNIYVLLPFVVFVDCWWYHSYFPLLFCAISIVKLILDNAYYHQFVPVIQTFPPVSSYSKYQHQ